jgi:UDP-glucose 4-epimerase
MPLGIPDPLKVRRVLVTGVAGFHGSHEAKALLKAGYTVYGVDDLSGGYRANVPAGCRFTRLDLRQRGAVDRYLTRTRPEVIIHDAAFATEGGSQFMPINSSERNYMMYLYLLIPAVRLGVKKMLVTSSMSVYGSQKAPFTEDMPRRPQDIYAISKASMEHATEVLSRVHGFSYTIIRPQNVYGPGQNMRDPYRNVIAMWINALMNRRPFWIYGDGRQLRSYTYIEDYTPYVLKTALSRRFHGEIFNVCSQEEISLNQLAALVLREFYGSAAAVPRNMQPRYFRPGRPLEVKSAFCSHRKAVKVLGYRTTVGIEAGVRKMVAWARTIGPKPFMYLKTGQELDSGKAPITWKKKLY